MESIRKIIRTVLSESLFDEKNVEVVNENLQLADKTYFTPGRLSPKVREIIVSKITNGDAWTKLICDIYFAMIQNDHAVGDWAVRSIDDPSAEIDRSERKLENDIMRLEDWKKVKSYYQQLKAYNKNVFPIIGLNPNGVKDIWSLIRALNQRAKILEDIKKLPAVALRNMRGDFRQQRDSSDLQAYRSGFEHFLAYYSMLGNRDARLRKTIENKMFVANVTLEDLLRFVEEKENLVGGAKFTKNSIKKLVSDNDYDMEIVYDKGNVMVVDVTSPDGIKKVGCNSLWCFTYGKGFDSAWRDWNNYSTNDHVYVIIDFSEQPDSPEFMHVLIKPLDYQVSPEDENEDVNDHKLFNMANQESYDAIGIVNHLVGEEAPFIMHFDEPVDVEGPSSKYPYEDPNQLKLDLQEVKKIIRESIQEIEQPKRIVGGVLVKCTTTDRVFLLLRNDPVPKWALVSGTIEDGENVLSGLKREFYEELFVNPSIVDFKFIRVEHIPEKNIEFHYYEGFVDKEFTPILDEENLDGKWFALGELPSPLYVGMPEKLGKIFKNPEVKEDKESDVFSESKEISDIDSKTKLSVFDFDSTLVNTPLPETGKQEWEQKTGTAWPGGWWGVEESLDTDVFDMTTNPEVISDYRREFSNPKNLVVMMTGRTGKLSNQVEKILSMNGLKFHDYLYNDGGETSADKIYKMEMILRYNPEIREIEMWDDRDSHIPTFQRWGENMISKGYLDNFNINHVK
jgi:8-oxo-dGTP pyrophosphatase MutT (NUDIX family)